MKITEGQLRKIIREEIEILNADTGELLTLDRLPPKYTGRLTKADGYDALYNSDFEALRRDLPPPGAMIRAFAERDALVGAIRCCAT